MLRERRKAEVIWGYKGFGPGSDFESISLRPSRPVAFLGIHLSQSGQSSTNNVRRFILSSWYSSPMQRMACLAKTMLGSSHGTESLARVLPGAAEIPKVTLVSRTQVSLNVKKDTGSRDPQLTATTVNTIIVISSFAISPLSRLQSRLPTMQNLTQLQILCKLQLSSIHGCIWHPRWMHASKMRKRWRRYLYNSSVAICSECLVAEKYPNSFGGTR